MRNWTFRINSKSGYCRSERITLSKLKPTVASLKAELPPGTKVVKPQAMVLLRHVLLNTYELGDVAFITIHIGEKG